jgi:hypothetical protein
VASRAQSGGGLDKPLVLQLKIRFHRAVSWSGFVATGVPRAVTAYLFVPPGLALAMAGAAVCSDEPAAAPGGGGNGSRTCC